MQTLNFDSSYSLQSIFWPKQDKIAKNILLLLTGVALLTLASQFSIPLKPIPLSFQSAMVLLIGMTYGAKRGAAVVSTYLSLGALGLPVFANGSFGFWVLVGPNGGYLFGFLLAALLAGYLAERGFARSFMMTLIPIGAGAAVIFLFGWLFLSAYLGMSAAFTLGVKPFLLTEPIKLLLISFLTPYFWKKKNIITE